MIRISAVALAAAICVGGPAQATTYSRCEKSEIEVIGPAITGARDMALAAAIQIGDSADFRRWFGRYNDHNGQIVRQGFKAINDVLGEGLVEARCGNLNEAACKDSVYAWVYRTEPYVINLCPNFFDMPSMFDLPNDDPEMENGTREGTIIHELTHFESVSNTDDLCYSRGPCTAMAARAPRDAVRNADSFQYFSEDVSYTLRLGPTVSVAVKATGRARR